MEYFRQRFIEELNDEGLVAVRAFEWPPADVLQTMAPNDYEAHFLEWVENQKQSARDRVRDSLEKYGCLERFNRLHNQLERQSVIPFVGAGLSKPTGFPLWGVFLKGLTADYGSVANRIVDLVDKYKYEDAAQVLIEHMGEDVFAEAVQNAFGSRSRLLKGPVQLLPRPTSLSEGASLLILIMFLIAFMKTAIADSTVNSAGCVLPRPPGEWQMSRIVWLGSMAKQTAVMGAC